MRGGLIPSTLRRFGLTGKTVPPNGLLIRFRTSVRPMLPVLSVAPMTAMFWGAKSASAGGSKALARERGRPLKRLMH